MKVDWDEFFSQENPVVIEYAIEDSKSFKLWPLGQFHPQFVEHNPYLFGGLSVSADCPKSLVKKSYAFMDHMKNRNFLKAKQVYLEIKNWEYSTTVLLEKTTHNQS